MKSENLLKALNILSDKDIIFVGSGDKFYKRRIFLEDETPDGGFHLNFSKKHVLKFKSSNPPITRIEIKETRHGKALLWFDVPEVPEGCDLTVYIGPNFLSLTS